MTHFIVMLFFALLVAVVFAIVSRDGGRERALYGLKIFAEFAVVGFALAWLLYWIPW